MPGSQPRQIHQAQRFIDSLQHCRQLGLQVEDAGPEQVVLRLNYLEEGVGNPETGVLHGGILTTLLDTACGTAVILALPDLELCPTLDLRVDYVRAAVPSEALWVRAECYRISRHVVFTRSLVHQGELTDPVAHGVATFMRLGPELTPEIYREHILSGTPIKG